MAFGLGLGIALACDFIVAASTARFSAAFINIGLSADVGVLFTLAQRVGTSRARVMLMRGEELSAVDAATIGLVDELTSPGGAAVRAHETAANLVTRPPLVLAAMKAAFRNPPTDLEESLRLETDLQVPLLGSADFAEAVSAFREKRRPQFSGR
jgi:2-(1,2-epoxy-1,2-dihydrophenyl)acetyl-CoA isomerase